MPDPENPTEPRHAGSELKHGETAGDAAESVLQNEYTGDSVRDGIPANGTRPTEARGPDDVGA